MEYEYWLARIRQLADWKKRRLREEYGSGEAIYYIEETKLHRLEYLSETDKKAISAARNASVATEEWKRLKESGICFVPYYSPDYPRRLRQISRPPYALYVKGRLPDEEKPAVAIVGARRCSHYGEQMALEYGEKLGAAGFDIISGMAKGIDGAAQRGALNGGGITYAVLGSGVDVCYPREHIGLYTDIQKQGGILSEQLPGQSPLPAHFPARNRLISGLADVILVMEARERSGSLITVDRGLEQGKDVYALPGPADSALSQGCHRLIRQGAGILVSPELLLEDLKMERLLPVQKDDKNEKVLESTENMVYSCLDLFPRSIGEVIDKTGLEAGKAMEILMSLVLKGEVKEVSRNYYVKNRY